MHSPVARGRIPSTVGQHLQTLGTLQQTHTHTVTLLHQIITYCRWYTRDILLCTHAKLTPMYAIIFLQTVEGAPNDQTVSSFLPEWAHVHQIIQTHQFICSQQNSLATPIPHPSPPKSNWPPSLWHHSRAKRQQRPVFRDWTRCNMVLSGLQNPHSLLTFYAVGHVPDPAKRGQSLEQCQK